jgi:succinate dehydrogenase / fumarate reductase membrane anchor subunit
MTDHVSDRPIMRSPLGRARGLGAAHHGAAHWLTERVLSLALVPLTLWFVVSVIGLAGAPYAEALLWFHRPLTTVLLLCLIVATFKHMDMGLRVVIDDYVHGEPARLITVLAVRGLVYLLGLAAVVSVLKLGLLSALI